MQFSATVALAYLAAIASSAYTPTDPSKDPVLQDCGAHGLTSVEVLHDWKPFDTYFTFHNETKAWSDAFSSCLYRAQEAQEAYHWYISPLAQGKTDYDPRLMTWCSTPKQGHKPQCCWASIGLGHKEQSPIAGNPDDWIYNPCRVNKGDIVG